MQSVPACVESATDDAPLGADSIEVDGAHLQLDNDAEDLHCDLVVCSVGPSSTRFTTRATQSQPPGPLVLWV
jgi:hypothetical protein